MKTSTCLSRFTRVLVLGAAVAAATAATAGAVGRPPDVRDVATANSAAPDVFERYAAAHPYGGGLSVVDRIVAQERGRHGDLAVFGSGLPSPSAPTIVSRPPDVSDAALAAATVSTGGGNGFDWADYGIGIGSGIGLSLLIAGALGAGLQRRGRMQTA